MRPDRRPIDAPASVAWRAGARSRNSDAGRGDPRRRGSWASRRDARACRRCPTPGAARHQQRSNCGEVEVHRACGFARVGQFGDGHDVWPPLVARLSCVAAWRTIAGSSSAGAPQFARGPARHIFAAGGVQSLGRPTGIRRRASRGRESLRAAIVSLRGEHRSHSCRHPRFVEQGRQAVDRRRGGAMEEDAGRRAGVGSFQLGRTPRDEQVHRAAQMSVPRDSR